MPNGLAALQCPNHRGEFGVAQESKFYNKIL